MMIPMPQQPANTVAQAHPTPIAQVMLMQEQQQQQQMSRNARIASANVVASSWCVVSTMQNTSAHAVPQMAPSCEGKHIRHRDEQFQGLGRV